LFCLPLAACVREPVDAVCPDVVEGDLVVTEVRGDQDPDDLDGEWIEVFNAAAGSVNLEGLKVRFRDRGGANEVSILVRRALVVAPGEYVVLGLVLDTDRPAHIDYGFLDDYTGDWKSAAAIDLESCGARIDLVTYDALPDVGTYSLGGEPDAETNNLPSSWCFDATPFGTPGAANNACPP
jgi:hypothetical protein